MIIDVATNTQAVSGHVPTFDVDRLEHQPWFYQLRDRLFLYPYLQYLLDFIRRFTPVFRIPFVGCTLILGYDQVREVLAKSERFPVPWGWKMELVTSTSASKPTEHGGRNFVLGMPVPDHTYQSDYGLLARAFPYDDARRTVAPLTRTATSEILDRYAMTGADRPFDIIENLIIQVPAALCNSYYGVTIPDKIYLAKCTLAISSFVFGLNFDDTCKGKALAEKEMALDASAPLRAIIRGSMWDANAAANDNASGVASPLHRLAICPRGSPPLDPDRIHTQFFGMILGFIPTNVLAGGNLLETMLRFPAFMKRAEEAALANDDELLWACLRETLRFRNINIGPLRSCPESCQIIGAKGRPVRIAKGQKIVACTQSAMFDGTYVAEPHEFDHGRADEDYMVFGLGQHWCLGAYIAIAQLTQMFKILLTRYRVLPIDGKEGRMKRFNVFPLHMNVRLVLR